MIVPLHIIQLMRTCVDNLIALPHLDGPRIRLEAEYLSKRLEVLRQKRLISNNAFLDAGAIQGAFSMIGNLVEMGIPQREIFSQTGISASTNAFSVSISGLDDYILESGETAAFRIFNENAGANGQFRVDNIAITGAVVPEPTTYALILGIFALGFAIRKQNSTK